MIFEKAHAKINLSLDITGKRANGYHDVRMIMQTLELCDELSFEKGESGVKLTTDDEMLNQEQAEGSDNLVIKAANKLSEAVGRTFDVNISLKKNIPIAAGMAGGSADAAAALRGLNRLFDLGLSNDELREIAVKIGADVPFCVEGGLALCEGIGEKLTPLKGPKRLKVLICKPNIFVSTKDVYVAYDKETHPYHPNVDDMAETLEDEDILKTAKLLGNTLESVTKSAHPVIGEIEKSMLDTGALNSIMTGSGPTVFGIFNDEALLLKGEQRLKESYPGFFVGRTYTLA